MFSKELEERLHWIAKPYIRDYSMARSFKYHVPYKLKM